MEIDWISVKDGFPPDSDWILIASKNPDTIDMGVYLDDLANPDVGLGSFRSPDLNYYEVTCVTHWVWLSEIMKTLPEKEVKDD